MIDRQVRGLQFPGSASEQTGASAALRVDEVQ